MRWFVGDGTLVWGSAKPAIAQLVEHLTVESCRNQIVPGSIPGGRISFLPHALMRDAMMPKRRILSRAIGSRYHEVSGSRITYDGPNLQHT